MSSGSWSFPPRLQRHSILNFCFIYFYFLSFSLFDSLVFFYLHFLFYLFIYLLQCFISPPFYTHFVHIERYTLITAYIMNPYTLQKNIEVEVAAACPGSQCFISTWLLTPVCLFQLTCIRNVFYSDTNTCRQNVKPLNFEFSNAK